MFGFLKGLFGSSNNVEKVVSTAADGIYNGLDKLVYTDEEKAEAFQRGQEVFLEFTKIAYDQNSIRSVARRWLAFMVVGPVMLAFSIAIFAPLFNETYGGHLITLVTLMGPWAAGVLAFYFGPHLLGSLRKGE